MRAFIAVLLQWTAAAYNIIEIIFSVSSLQPFMSQLFIFSFCGFILTLISSGRVPMSWSPGNFYSWIKMREGSPKHVVFDLWYSSLFLRAESLFDGSIWNFGDFCRGSSRRLEFWLIKKKRAEASLNGLDYAFYRSGDRSNNNSKDDLDNIVELKKTWETLANLDECRMRKNTRKTRGLLPVRDYQQTAIIISQCLSVCVCVCVCVCVQSVHYRRQ